jgi:polysaccharide export outer membrane protein
MRFFSLLFIALVCMASCTTPKQTGINYLEQVNDTSIKGMPTVQEPVIQRNDLLAITVYSASINPVIDAPYNLPQQPGTGGTNAPSGFLVDASGNIEYPRLGTIKAEGLTKSELANQIKLKLQGQLTSPSVIIRFINYKVTVLGEVRVPGTYTVPAERVTIFEALGLAGDVTEFGRRNNVKVYRENNGQRDIVTLDLTDKSMFNSPFYVLQQNDIVFVEQNTERSRQRNQQNTAQQVGIITGIITTIALILNFIK